MRVIESVTDMQAFSLECRGQGRRIGLVPTMGALHDGHMALVQQARGQCDVLVVSLFVNPTQFGPGEDLDAYPRTFVDDRRLCRDAGVDVLFMPGAETVYAPDHSVYVEELTLSRGLCGASRPGHFRGVTTVVCKLFNVVLPDIAVFGEKDAQQLRVIERMVRDLSIPVEVIRGATVREADGLAMSSRNRYLSPAGRMQALCLSQSLAAVRAAYAAGERQVLVLEQACRARFAGLALAEVDYVSIVDDVTLAPVSVIERPVLVALAVRIEGTRLIDNMVIGR